MSQFEFHVSRRRGKRFSFCLMFFELSRGKSRDSSTAACKAALQSSLLLLVTGTNSLLVPIVPPQLKNLTLAGVGSSDLECPLQIHYQRSRPLTLNERTERRAAWASGARPFRLNEALQVYPVIDRSCPPLNTLLVDFCTKLFSLVVKKVGTIVVSYLLNISCSRQLRAKATGQGGCFIGCQDPFPAIPPSRRRRRRQHAVGKRPKIYVFR